MKPDHVLEEVRAARDEYGQRFNCDLRAICRDHRKREQPAGRKPVVLPPRRPAGQAAAAGVEER